MVGLKYKISFFDASEQYLSQKEEIDEAIQNVLTAGTFINGKDVAAFSANLASYLKINYVIPCANGTDALSLALMALNLEKGTEVIVPAFNFIAAVEVVALLGLIPVFVDVCPNDFNIDFNQIENVITSKTRAIIAVHLFGAAAQMSQIKEISEKYNLFLIEDVAQALGSEYKNQKLGTLGHIGCTSFFPTKNLGCFGDGGAVFTDDEALATKLKMTANHGQRIRYEHEVVGINSRLDTLQSAILNVKLSKLDYVIDLRRDIAKRYFQQLVDLVDISLPKESAVTKHSFNQYCILLENQFVRDGLKEFLTKKDIGTMVYYPKPTHLQDAFTCYGYIEGDFPISEELCSRVLALPIYPNLMPQQQDYIIKNIKTFFNYVS